MLCLSCKVAGGACQSGMVTRTYDDSRASLGEHLGDCPPVSAGVSNASDKSDFIAQVDGPSLCRHASMRRMAKHRNRGGRERKGGTASSNTPCECNCGALHFSASCLLGRLSRRGSEVKELRGHCAASWADPRVVLRDGDAKSFFRAHLIIRGAYRQNFTTFESEEIGARNGGRTKRCPRALDKIGS